MLMFTSGTSGRPRAAMLSHRALLTNLEQCLALEPTPMGEDDVVLLVLPLFHIYGLNTGLGMVAATAATGVLAERFDPAGTASVVRRRGRDQHPRCAADVRRLGGSRRLRRAARRPDAGLRGVLAAARRAGAGADRGGHHDP